MEKNIDFTWKIGGEAGFGIMVTGATFGKLCTRSGLNVISTVEYPSLIRGGHNTFIIRAAEEKIYSLKQTINLLVALNKETYDLHREELESSGMIIFDPHDFQPEPNPSLEFLPVPFFQLAKDNKGNFLMRNTVALGASIAVLGMDFSLLEEMLRKEFERKGEEVVNLNINIAKAGYAFVLDNLKQTPRFKLNRSSKPKILATGNEALGAGAVSSGMKFFASYPMTPVNGLITYFTAREKKFNLVYKQPEDEIAAINMAVGASYAGVRAMTASSGGGFALMNEGFSLAGMTETPLVVVYGQRPGPASGLPTWTSQGDLKYALAAGHGEFLRFVFTPGDIEECFWLTKLAFNMADFYQTPVIVLVDKYLCESYFSAETSAWQKPQSLPENVWQKAQTINRGKMADKTDGNYLRYKITEDGISPRAIPGKGPVFTVNSYEHDEEGLSTEKSLEIKAMVDKRKKKMILAQAEAFGPIEYGEKNANLTLVGWGSTKQAVLEALKNINSSGKITARYLHFPCLSPFPVENTQKLLAKTSTIINVEGNSQGQLAMLIREKTGIEITDNVLKYDGRQFYPEEIISAVNVISKGR
ncbi:2-oxoacid:acceptor oxidoreductase subunit alpha [Candidatus Microgenomates bacterium]|nr:2-oxoacid:acceptor oxidoreductase subunit alpha [Candidatus Microgenomates bacterium]